MKAGRGEMVAGNDGPSTEDDEMRGSSNRPLIDHITGLPEAVGHVI